MTLRDGRLRGRAVAVPHASRADLIVALARSNDGPVAAVLRAGDGVAVSPSESTDPAHPFDDVDVNAAPVAVAPIATLDAAVAAPLVAAAADLLGVAGAALQRSVEHAKTRRQFGTPIGAFQGVKHALADNYVGLERARSLTYAAAHQLDAPSSTAWTAAAMAKAAAADAATDCARTAVQVFGALGQTWEHDAHLYVRHAWQGGALLGDSRALYNEVGRRFAGAGHDGRRRVHRVAHRVPAARLSPALPGIPLGHRDAARAPAGRLRSRLAATHLAAPARRPLAGVTGRDGNPHRGCPSVGAQTAQRPGSRRRRTRPPPVRHARADRPSAGSPVARRRVVGAGDVRAGSRVGFRRVAHPRRTRR